MKRLYFFISLLLICTILAGCSVICDAPINEEFYNEIVTQPGVALKTEVRALDGVPHFYVNDTPIVTNALFVNTDIYTSAIATQVEMAYKNGVRLFSTICYLNPMQTDFSDKTAVKKIYSERLKQITDIAKNAVVILRVDVGSYQPGGDENEYETDKDGNVNSRISIGSEKWATNVEKGLKALTKTIREDDEACDHVAIIHLDNQEFFQRVFPDVSAANTACFREWLTKKYKTDLALSAAWKTEETLQSATIPTKLRSSSSATLFGGEEQNIIDYYDYIGQITAQRINSFSKAIKEASQNETGVIAFYGYYYELYSPSSGHFSFQTLLQSPFIDGFAAPTTYLNRSVNSTSAYMTAVDSVTRNGKIWFQESDQRTTLAYDGVPTADGLVIGGVDEIILKHTYEHGMNLVHANGTWEMDLLSKGWLADNAIWQNIKTLDAYERAYIAAEDSLPCFDVLFVIDEAAESLAAVSNMSTQLAALKTTAYRLGMSTGFAEMKDVINGKFNDAKLYIFLNPYRLSQPDAEKLSSVLHRENKTSVFYYGFGNLDKAVAGKLLRMEIKSSEAVRPTSLVPTEEAEKLGFKRTLSTTRFLPRTIVTSGVTTPLATYGTSTDIAAAVHEEGSFKTVFIGAGDATENDIKALASLAGVHSFTDDSDNISANQNLLIFQATNNIKTKTLYFDRTLDVYDVFEKKWYEGVSQISFESKDSMVKWFLYGTKSRLEKYIAK